MVPGVAIITPIRDLQLSREAEIEYLKSKGVDNATADDGELMKELVFRILH